MNPAGLAALALSALYTIAAAIAIATAGATAWLLAPCAVLVVAGALARRGERRALLVNLALHAAVVLACIVVYAVAANQAHPQDPSAHDVAYLFLFIPAVTSATVALACLFVARARR